MNGASSVITVVICTYNRAELLRLCLEALDWQDAEPTSFAVLVVNNCCTDETSQVVSEHVTMAPYSLLEVFEKCPGASHARNRGVRECDSQWVAFLDDDAKPHTGWIRAIQTFIADYPNAAMFGGPVLPYYLTPPPVWLPAEVGRIWHGERVVRLPYKKCFLGGGNLVARRKAFEIVGGFDTHLGPRGDVFHYGEDTAFYRQALVKDLPVYYTPDLVVDHLVRPEKYKLYWHFVSLRELGCNLFRRLGLAAGILATLCMVIAAPLLALSNFCVFMDVPFLRRLYFAFHPLGYALGMLLEAGRSLAKMGIRWRGSTGE